MQQGCYYRIISNAHEEIRHIVLYEAAKMTEEIENCY